MKKKIVSILMLVSLILNTFSYAVDVSETEEKENNTYSELAKTVYSQSREISDGLTYTRNILSHEKDGPQREFILEYIPNSFTNFHFGENKYLYSVNTVSNIAKNAYPDENFVAGINGDFFNMSTGVPESAYIKNYELYTTDRDSFCFAENEDGSYFIDKPQITLSLTDTNDNTYKVLHLNKEFSEYGLYMYNSRYSERTRIQAETTDIILYPYEAKYLLEEAVEITENDEIFDLYNKYLSSLEEEQKAEIEEKQDDENNSVETSDSENLDETESSNITDKTEFEEDTDVSKFTEESEENPKSSQTVNDDNNAKIKEKLSDTYKENLIKLIQEQLSLQYIGEFFYKIADIFPRIGGSENLVAADVIYNSKNSVIPENTYVISAVKNIYDYQDLQIKTGDELLFFIDGNENFYNVVNAIGTDTVILSDGEIVESKRLDHYSSKQPRSAIGIKDDGSILLYACDGRQGSYSKGLTLKELAEQMKSLGCKYAANLDGGGSTLLSASLYGYDSSITQNKPSAGSERRVSNAFIFTNTREKSGEVYGAYNYDEIYLTLNDQNIELGKVVYSDISGFASDYNEADEEKTYKESLILYTKGDSYVEDFVFHPNDAVGNIEIYASFDDGETENVFTNVVSVSEPDEIIITADKYEIAPFESVKLDVNSKYLSFDVACDFDSFIWTSTRIKTELEKEKTEDEENIDDKESSDYEEQEITKEEADIQETKDEVVGVIEDGIFTPFVEGAEIEIKAERGSASESIRIKVDLYPFVDIKDHWSVKNVYSLAKKGIVKGEIDENGISYYFPERKYTRNEFCVMLLRVTGIGKDIEVPERNPVVDDILPDLKDENLEAEIQTAQEEKDSINLNEDAFNENEIPEENVDIEPKESSDNNSEEEPTLSVLPYSDADLIPDWAYEEVYKLTESGLIEGIIHTDENGNLLFDGNAEITREEVMLVLGKLCVPDTQENKEGIIITEIENISDLTQEQKENEFIVNTIKCGIFSGYEDNTIRPENSLSRAEAATVFSRLIDVLD